MIKLYGRQYTKEEILSRVGDISQIAGMKYHELKEGNQKGVEAVDFWTGSGFAFTVLPGRGLDISYASYNGIPLCWRSPTGEVAASFFEPEGSSWLRGFFGGLLVTCGLTYLGSPGNDGDESLGLHGRASYTPAKNIWLDSKWEGNDYTMWVQGKVQESIVYGANLCLTRRIWTRLGESKLHIYDVVENLGYTASPHMILYHINGGFPALDENSELLVPSKNVIPRDDIAEAALGNELRFQAPTPGFAAQVFYHDAVSDSNDHVYVALVNRNFNHGQGFGIYVRYHKSQLPKLVEWKMNSQGLYVVGIEPSNCWVDGRQKEKERGTLQYIESGGRRHYELEIGVLSSIKEIEEIERKIEFIKRQ